MLNKKLIPETTGDNVLQGPRILASPKVTEEFRYPVMLVGEVWEKGKKEFGFFFFKRDQFGKIIAKHEYGKKTQYGWEIVHVIPLEQGGTNDVGNLIPVHWENVNVNNIKLTERT